MAFPELYRYTVVGKPCTLRTTYYPFGPHMQGWAFKMRVTFAINSYTGI